MTEKNLIHLIGVINEKLTGGKKIFLYKVYEKYNLRLKCNNEYNPYKELISNVNEQQIYLFLKGMLQTLDILKKK